MRLLPQGEIVYRERFPHPKRFTVCIYDMRAPLRSGDDMLFRTQSAARRGFKQLMAPVKTWHLDRFHPLEIESGGARGLLIAEYRRDGCLVLSLGYFNKKAQMIVLPPSSSVQLDLHKVEWQAWMFYGGPLQIDEGEVARINSSIDDSTMRTERMRLREQAAKQQAQLEEENRKKAIRKGKSLLTRHINRLKRLEEKRREKWRNEVLGNIRAVMRIFATAERVLQFITESSFQEKAGSETQPCSRSNLR